MTEDEEVLWSERKTGELMQMDRLTRGSAERIAGVFLFYHKLNELKRELRRNNNDTEW